MTRAEHAVPTPSKSVKVTLAVDSGASSPPDAPLTIALDVHFPASERLHTPPRALVCVPGGGMSRRYFDLMPQGDDGEDTSFSFARYMAARGFIVIALDPLGVGDSARPADGFSLTPTLLTRANAEATAKVMGALALGELSSSLPPLARIVSIGVGHSMGAMLTILQQVAKPKHSGVCLLGFSTRGLPDYLPAEAQALLEDRAALRAALPQLARSVFGVPYPEIKGTSESNAIFAGRGAQPAGIAALKAARACVLPLPALWSMLPGNVAPEAAQIEVPVFLGLGERDMAGPPHQVPAAFTACRDVRLHVAAGAGHSHFLFPTRIELFRRIAEWAESLDECAVNDQENS